MNKVRIGVICPSEIAFRRFMPALKQLDEIEYVGVASANAQEWFEAEQAVDETVIENEQAKAQSFADEYGGKVFKSYTELIISPEVDAVYLPLPPALHFKWAKLALENNKHVFLEKPSTVSEKDTKKLVEIAAERGLALHENYMFVFHKQLDEINDIIKSGKIGDVRLYRIAFGFPLRAKNDFRYNKELGGGSLLDCGGYTLKLASMLLGDTAQITYSQLNYKNDFEVDMYGSAAMVNDNGITAQISFGMDNSYKCELEVWGSKGCLTTGRILTAPAGFVPTADIRIGNETETVTLSADDTFARSILKFCRCVADGNERINNYKALIKQAELVDQVKGAGRNGNFKNNRA